MTLFIDLLFIALGFTLLVKGGDWLVRGAVSVARLARLSPMVIGLTVVGFGTSAPELLVSVAAAWHGSSGLAIGNVVGSNIANIALILGLTAALYSLPTDRRTMRLDLPFMLLSVILLTLVGMSGEITRLYGLAGLLLLWIYVGWQVRDSRRRLRPTTSSQGATCATDKEAGEEAGEGASDLSEFRQYSAPLSLLICLLSFAALAGGAQLLIEGASSIARLAGEMAGIDPVEMERIIGLTIVAVGTSLPELFATLMAARRGQSDIALGNVIGSVTFNILNVIGLAALITPIAHADRGFAFDYIAMTLLSLLLYLFLHTHKRLERWEGWIFVLLYAAYLTRTVLI